MSGNDWGWDKPEINSTCHCGRPFAYGFDGDPTHHRGMCADCDAVRCDAYPMECPHHDRAPYRPPPLPDPVVPDWSPRRLLRRLFGARR